MTEKVLVFPAQLIDGIDFGDGLFGGDRKDVLDLFGKIIASEKMEYIDREIAEKSPEFKQFIPYTVITQSGQIFSYERTSKGGESRLHNKHSIGVGGHINPKDGEGISAYWRAFWRELDEEVEVFSGESVVLDAPIVGLLYDNSTDVGRVHFGVIHLLEVTEELGTNILDEGLTNGRFISKDEALENIDQYEKWSQLVLENLL